MEVGIELCCHVLSWIPKGLSCEFASVGKCGRVDPTLRLIQPTHLQERLITGSLVTSATAGQWERNPQRPLETLAYTKLGLIFLASTDTSFPPPLVEHALNIFPLTSWHAYLLALMYTDGLKTQALGFFKNEITSINHNTKRVLVEMWALRD